MLQDVGRLTKERGLAGMVVFAHDLYLRACDRRAHPIHDPMERVESDPRA